MSDPGILVAVLAPETGSPGLDVGLEAHELGEPGRAGMP